MLDAESTFYQDKKVQLRKLIRDLFSFFFFWFGVRLYVLHMC